MSAPFDSVDDKLREADFFICKMEQADWDINEWRYHFSAFVTAARSVTFALQYSMSDIPGFDEWYKQRQECLRGDSLSQFFVAARNNVQKKGQNPLSFWDRDESGKIVAYFLYWFEDQVELTPDCDAITACKQHMKSLSQLVYEAYRDFGPYIDPAVAISPLGAKELGLTIEDMEEQIIGVRGWTSTLPLVERFRMLRDVESMPQIDDLLIKYLGHDRFGKLSRLTGPAEG